MSFKAYHSIDARVSNKSVAAMMSGVVSDEELIALVFFDPRVLLVHTTVTLLSYPKPNPFPLGKPAQPNFAMPQSSASLQLLLSLCQHSLAQTHGWCLMLGAASKFLRLT